jgi:hypothetical protein
VLLPILLDDLLGRILCPFVFDTVGCPDREEAGEEKSVNFATDSKYKHQ